MQKSRWRMEKQFEHRLSVVVNQGTMGIERAIGPVRSVRYCRPRHRPDARGRSVESGWVWGWILRFLYI